MYVISSGHGGLWSAELPSGETAFQAVSARLSSNRCQLLSGDAWYADSETGHDVADGRAERVTGVWDLAHGVHVRPRQAKAGIDQAVQPHDRTSGLYPDRKNGANDRTRGGREHRAPRTNFIAQAY
jgi:hypothetical protein